MARVLHCIGLCAVRKPWRFIIAWIVVGAAVVAAAIRWGTGTTQEFTIPGAESEQAVALLEERFPDRAGDPVLVVFAAQEGSIADPRYAEPIGAALERLGAIDEVAMVTDPLAPGPGRMVSSDGRVALAVVPLGRATGELGSGVLPAFRDALRAARQIEGLRVEVSGALLQYAEEQEVGGRSEVIGVAAAVVVLLVAFSSVVAMGLPIVTALLGVGIGISLLCLVANLMTVDTVAPVLASMIGIAVGIDYALFVITRHREHLARGLPWPTPPPARRCSSPAEPSSRPWSASPWCASPSSPGSV